MPFLHTNLYKITFLTAEICISKSVDNIIKEFNTGTNLYKAISKDGNVRRGQGSEVHWGGKFLPRDTLTTDPFPRVRS